MRIICVNGDVFDYIDGEVWQFYAEPETLVIHYDIIQIIGVDDVLISTWFTHNIRMIIQ